MTWGDTFDKVWDSAVEKVEKACEQVDLATDTVVIANKKLENRTIDTPRKAFDLISESYQDAKKIKSLQAGLSASAASLQQARSSISEKLDNTWERIVNTFDDTLTTSGTLVCSSPELREALKVGGNITGIFELSLDGLKRVYGKEAFRRYNTLWGKIAKNRSGNLRGIVISKEARRLYNLIDKNKKRFGVIGKVFSGAEETVTVGEESYEDLMNETFSNKEKAGRVTANVHAGITRFGVKIPGDLVGGVALVGRVFAVPLDWGLGKVGWTDGNELTGFLDDVDNAVDDYYEFIDENITGDKMYEGYNAAYHLGKNTIDSISIINVPSEN